MGFSRSSADFIGKLKNAGEELKRGQTSAVRNAAFAAKVVFEHAPGKPSRVAGKAVGVRVKLMGDKATVRYTGAAHLVDRDTKAHRIGPRRRKAIALADGNVRSVVQHPGTRGKHFYARAKPVAADRANKAYQSSAHRDLVKVFGG